MADQNNQTPPPPFDPTQLERFAKGELTLAELEGVDANSQRKLAEMGYRLLESGKLDDAKHLFEGLVALNPKEPYFLTAAGSVAQQQERFVDAEHWYTLSLERSPQDPVCLTHRGEVRLMLGSIEGATEDLIAAIKLDPKGDVPQTKRAVGLLAEIRRQLESQAAR